MIHPHTCIRYVNPQIGYGVFATAFIPKGTIVYVKDDLELEISPEAYEQHSPELREVIEKYSYIDQRGVRIVSWDFAKYVNHCCQCNTLSTGYGFEIAIRDIQEGEEITDDYGLFNLEQSMPLSCSQPGCRGFVGSNDFDQQAKKWDEKALSALQQTLQVAQPLWSFLDEPTRLALTHFLGTGKGYRSVVALKHLPASKLQARDSIKINARSGKSSTR
jgi:hypothetical protein